MKLWNDGRSGTVGCLVGNLVLAHIRDIQNETFSERKGTTFYGRDAIWVGRICATDAYLSARDRHWANLSIDQHREVMSDASLSAAKVKYLFITALMNQPSVHYWIIPGDIIDRIAFAEHLNDPVFVFSLHIRENNGRYEVEQEDVTCFHNELHLSPADAASLDHGFADARRTIEKRAARRPSRAGLVDVTAVSAEMPESEFRIPLRGGRSAVLCVPRPTAEVDLQRIKGWIDLMSDVLTENATSDQTAPHGRERATQALGRLQELSLARGSDKISDEQIESEVLAARRERTR
jgi:hypothetical protein